MSSIVTANGKVVQHVAVLYGGFSHEGNFTAHTHVMDALKKLSVKATLIDVRATDFIIELQALKADVAFITNQGAYGEDGKLQGLLEFIDLPYIGSGVSASAIGMNKLATKIFFTGLGIKTPAYYYSPYEDHVTYTTIATQLGEKIIVKPIMTGGSFGVVLVENEDQFNHQYHALKEEFGDLLIEEYVGAGGKEYFAGILQDDQETYALPVFQVTFDAPIYNNKIKYSGSDTKQLQEANISPFLIEKMQRTMKQIFTAMGCQGLARIDTIISGEEIYFLEINTLPGMLTNSIFPQQCLAMGFTYKDVVTKLIKASFRRRPMEIPKLIENLPKVQN